MGLFKRLLSKDASNATIPMSIPPPPEEEIDIPPLPPGQGPDLPDLSPGEMAFSPMSQPMQQAPPQQFMAQSSPPPQYVPQEAAKPQESPGLRTAEEARVLDEYENTSLSPTEKRLPFGAMISPHAEDTQEVIPDKRQSEGPLFIRVNDYRMFIEGQNQVKNDLREADNIITRLNEIKVEEDKQFEQWRVNLEEIQKKIAVVDKKIFESG